MLVEVLDPEMEDSLENEGANLTFDTRQMLNFVEQEKLSAEEISDVKSKLGII